MKEKVINVKENCCLWIWSIGGGGSGCEECSLLGRNTTQFGTTTQMAVLLMLFINPICLEFLLSFVQNKCWRLMVPIIPIFIL
jgi:hypothetical protein